MDDLTFLEDWYANQCDGDWEHGSGIEIGTLDNPGWRVKVDLEGTSREGRQLDRDVVDRTEHDWYEVWSDGRSWEAACGPQNLREVLGRVRQFLEGPS